MSETREPIVDVNAALALSAAALDSRPDVAAAQAREILAEIPDEPRALFLFGAAQRRLGQATAAVETLSPLAAAQPNAPRLHLELGLALLASGEAERARAALSHAAALSPNLAPAWLALADCAHLLGDGEAADAAYARHLQAAATDPKLVEAGAALAENRLAVAERLLKDHLKTSPTDVAALRMLGEAAGRLGRVADAVALLSRSIELAPNFLPARFSLALVLHRAGKPAEALAALAPLRAAAPDDLGYLNLEAAVRARLGDVSGSIALYERVLAAAPRFFRGWMSFGHVLKTAGRKDACVEAYRRAIALQPAFGEAYWSLANIKTYRFSAEEIEAMTGQLARADLGDDDRLHFDYALGKALEDEGRYAESFRRYAAGAKLRRAQIPYDAAETTRSVDRAKALFTAEFFAARKGWGAPAPDPIFVVGLPRSGSTLIEQILSSHSQVEGADELPELEMIVRELGGRRRDSYPECLADLDAGGVRALGEDYLARTRAYRKTDRPFFIDKMPNNWEHAPLIRLILPNAKIIDARRHPMAACFSAFKQHFARGQSFSYDLEDLGRYYSDYAALIAHLNAVLPGAARTVFYERMIGDTEAEVRALLTHCGLAFEPACLSFWENDRPVRTASAEQVRRPIFTDSVEHWRRYASELAPLAAALGPCLQAYPGAPQSAAEATSERGVLHATAL